LGGRKKGLSDSVKVYEFPNSLRDSTAEDLISRYPKTFAKYPKNKAEIFDIYIVATKQFAKRKLRVEVSHFIQHLFMSLTMIKL